MGSAVGEKRLRCLGHLMREDDDEPAKQISSRETERAQLEMVPAVDVRFGLKERYSKKGSIFGVRQINLESVELCKV